MYLARPVRDESPTWSRAIMSQQSGTTLNTKRNSARPAPMRRSSAPRGLGKRGLDAIRPTSVVSLPVSLPRRLWYACERAYHETWPVAPRQKNKRKTLGGSLGRGSPKSRLDLAASEGAHALVLLLGGTALALSFTRKILRTLGRPGQSGGSCAIVCAWCSGTVHRPMPALTGTSRTIATSLAIGRVLLGFVLVVLWIAATPMFVNCLNRWLAPSS